MSTKNVDFDEEGEDEEEEEQEEYLGEDGEDEEEEEQEEYLGEDGEDEEEEEEDDLNDEENKLIEGSEDNRRKEGWDFLMKSGISPESLLIPAHLRQYVENFERPDEDVEFDVDLLKSAESLFPRRFTRTYKPWREFGYHEVSKDGVIMNTYEDVETAANATGVSAEEIFDVANKCKTRTSKNRLFVYDTSSQSYQEWIGGVSVAGEDSESDESSNSDEYDYDRTTVSSSSVTRTGKRKRSTRKSGAIHSRSFQVEQFSLEGGETIKTFKNWINAMEICGVSRVLHVCLGLSRMADGFGWRFIGDNAASFLEYRVKQREVKLSAKVKASGLSVAGYNQMQQDKTRNAQRLRRQKRSKNLIAAAAMPGVDGDLAKMKQDKTRNAHRLYKQKSREKLKAAAARPGVDGDSARMQQDKTREANRLWMQKKRRAASGATGEVGQEETREAHAAKSRKKAKKEAVAESAGEEI